MPDQEKRNWYAMEAGEVAAFFKTSPERGLDSASVDELRKIYGFNRLRAPSGKTYLSRFMGQLKDTMILMLLAAAAVSFILGERVDAVVIMSIVVVNALFGVFQEAKAEEALEALKNLSSPGARVIRGGQLLEVDAAGIVPGDIFQLEAGDLVPADGRLIEVSSLRAEESALTGESTPAEKCSEALLGDVPGIGDRKNMVYSGSLIVYGRGRAIAVGTGMDTEVGKIAGLLLSAEERATPLQKKLAGLGKVLGGAALAICSLIFLIGSLQGRDPFEMFFIAVSLAVAAIPEGLPAIVTVVLALGVRRMVRKRAIVRKLPAVESLGSASVICSDKTGTLTQNRMTVMNIATSSESLRLSGDKPVVKILELGVLCNDATVEVVDGVEKSIGDPIETALLSAADKAGIDREVLQRAYARVGELPFDSERKLMTTVHKTAKGYLAVTKGAPDILFTRCSRIAGENGCRAATKEDIARIEQLNDEMGQRALRVLALAFREYTEMPAPLLAESMEKDLTYAGMIGMIDPPRPEAKAAVATCKSAGIRPVMITGDHRTTAVAIAREIGILDERGVVATGQDLDGMNQETLELGIEDISVYARVSPEHKVRIVSAWQSRGHVVAMTGDGVNDAPALKKADIGCAMGMTGTDVAKGAADIVLTDDNFATIVEAIREGRGIYENIRQAVHFLLSCNLAEILVLFAAVLFNWEMPLLPIHLLWINLVTDSLPALALGMERVPGDIMRHPPRDPAKSFFADGLAFEIVFQGVILACVSLVAFYSGRKVSLELAYTSTFLVLSLSQLVHAWNVRSEKSLFRIGFFTNPWMIRAFFVSLALQLVVVLVPFLRGVFKVVLPDLWHWGYIALLSLLPLLLVELVKKIRGRLA